MWIVMAGVPRGLGRVGDDECGRSPSAGLLSAPHCDKKSSFGINARMIESINTAYQDRDYSREQYNINWNRLG
jgi:hypothetical protein